MEQQINTRVAHGIAGGEGIQTAAKASSGDVQGAAGVICERCRFISFSQSLGRRHCAPPAHWGVRGVPIWTTWL